MTTLARSWLACAGALLLLTGALAAQTVKAEAKISATSGGFAGPLADGDRFGEAVATLGDLDGDGSTEIAVGAPYDAGGGTQRGAVWILSVDASGSVVAERKLAEGLGGFSGQLDDGDRFGSSLARVGDLDGDGITELAVGALADDDGGLNRGAVWILFLDSGGGVKAQQKISDTAGGFGLVGNDIAAFGSALAPLGDLDGDSVCDLAAGESNDDDGGSARGAVWILFLEANGSVKSAQKISDTSGGFGGTLADNDVFGASLALLGDLDGDGTVDLAAGAPLDDDGGPQRGGLWVLFLRADGTVRAERKISATEGGFAGPLEDRDYFGSSLAAVGDLDGDGRPDLAVGARGDDDGSIDGGALWVLLLWKDASVKRAEKVSATAGGFGGDLDFADLFGVSLVLLGDLDGDAFPELGVGAIGDDDGGAQRGALWILFSGCPDRATALVRNGSGANAVRYTSASTPVHGAAWSATVDCSGHAPGSFVLVARAAPSAGTLLAAGELLVDPSSALLGLFVAAHAGDLRATPPFVVPSETALCGARLYTQVAILGAPGPELTNALDLRLGGP